MIVFREAVRNDLPVIVDIYNSIVAGRMVTADTEPVTVESRVSWFEEHSSARPLWIVEDADSKTLGWVSLKPFYGRPAYNATKEIAIYLESSCRGKGYGKRILAEAEKRCLTLGVQTLLGFIFSHNEPSIRLFRQAGYTVWGQLPDVAELDGQKRSLSILGKRL
jgi:phosphinothricin acetyltransferase